jgi:hypothetical protein
MTGNPKSDAPKTEEHHEEQRKLDDALDDSFPASDPPSMTQPPQSKSDKKPGS